MESDEFARWAQECQQRLLRSAFLITGDLGLAEDRVQEALVKVGLRWPRLRATNPTAYAHTIIARDHVSWWRRHRREQVGTHEHAAEPTATDPGSDTRLVVLKALDRLTPAQRRVLVLRHFDDLTERETATILGVSVGTVKSQNAAALARLRSGAPELLDLVGRHHV